MLTHDNVEYWGHTFAPDGLPLPYRNYAIYYDASESDGPGEAWIVCHSDEHAPGQSAYHSPVQVSTGGGKAAAKEALRRLDSFAEHKALHRRYAQDRTLPF